MGWSGGNYTKWNTGTGGWAGDAAAGTAIVASRHDQQDDDFQNGINQCLTKNGANLPTANLPMNSYKHTNVADATAATEYATLGQIEKGITVKTAGTNGPSVAIQNFNSGDVQPRLAFYKSRGGSVGSNTIVQSGDTIGEIDFWAANGSDYNVCAGIVATIDNTPGASNDMPGRLTFLTTADGAGSFTERMRITSAGNVGIGTGAPSDKLHVNGVLRVDSASAPTWDSGFRFWQEAGWGARYDGYAHRFDVGNTRTEALRITTTGRVGIGSTAPNSLFDISGGVLNGGGVSGAYAQATFGLDQNQSTYNKLVIENLNGNANYINHIRQGSTAGSFNIGTIGADDLFLRTNNNDRITIKSGGNVGIGTTSPSYQLQLSTDSAAKPTTNTWTIASDARIKTNVRPYAKGLAELKRVEPIEYDYNGKGGMPAGPGGVSIIAQHLQPVFPECVGTFSAKLNEDDEETTELYNYNGHAMTFALINAIKELAARVEALEGKATEEATDATNSEGQ
jgi:hypothetical protein